MRKLLVVLSLASVASTGVCSTLIAQSNSNVQNDVRGGSVSSEHGPVAADEVSRVRKEKKKMKKEGVEKDASKAGSGTAKAAANASTKTKVMGSEIPSRGGVNNKAKVAAGAQPNSDQNKMQNNLPTNKTFNSAPGEALPARPAYAAPYSTNSASSPGYIVSPSIRSRTANVTKNSQPSPWGFSYTSYNAIGLAGLENASKNPDDYEVLATDRFNLTYNITDNITAGVLAEFDHSWFGNPNRAAPGQVVVAGVPQFQQPGSAYLGDTALTLSDSKIAKLKGGITVDGYTRYYLPTSEASQLSGTYGMSRSSIGLTKSVGIVDFHIAEQLRYYFQQYQTSTALTTSDGKPVQNYNYRVFSLLDTGVNITKKLTFTVETGFENREYYGDTSATTPRPVVEDFLYILNPDVTYSFNKTFALSIGLWDETSLIGRTAAYSPFDAIQNGVEAYLQGKVSF